MISVLFFLLKWETDLALYSLEVACHQWESGFLAWIADLQNTMEGDNMKPDSIKAKIKEELFKR